MEAGMFATLAVLAALCFAVGGYFTKLSLGLTARGPTAMMFALFLAGWRSRRWRCGTSRWR